MSASAGWVDEKVLIPDLLRAAPQVRPVLDRYGLRGCGGPAGPVESLAFFAKAHDVPLERLLHEVQQALKQPAAPAPAADPDSRLADAIYRPFFTAGIAVVLTLGAVWGAYLLLRIGFTGMFAAAGLHEVNAHGHAQIFGWVGLFVMGFAYQAFPRLKHASLSHPRPALATLWLMVVGLIGRSVAEPLVGSLAWAGTAAVAASVLEVSAIGLFVCVIGATWRASGKPLEFYDYYVVSALAWFVIQAVYETVYLAATVSVTEREQLLTLVATWQGALRETQIHGFALLMILGVSQRIFHYFYGFPAPDQRLSAAALVALNAAVVGEVAGLILMRTAGPAWAALWYASVLLLGAAVAALVWNWRIFSPCREGDRSLKFLRAAYGWLGISLAMLVLLPAYQYGLLPWLAPEGEATRLGFSHAYYGAIRHAITVGFISLMIVGVAAKVVPTLNGVDVHRLAPLWVPFVLINAGCALRVVAQTLTDFTVRAFPVAGVSGVLEVLGLAVWGIHLGLIMAGRARTRQLAGSAEPADTPRALDAPIVATNRVGEVLDRQPALLDTFLAFGFRPLANPFLRQTVARSVTIERACRQLGVDVQRLLEALNAAREQQRSKRRPLDLVSAGAPVEPTPGRACCDRCGPAVT
jgi:hypothetical protein